MTLGTQVTTPQKETAESVAEQLALLLPSLSASSTEKDQALAMISRLTVPVDPAWLMARVASLMLPYFEKDTPAIVREMEMEDWADALGEFPKWAINNAVKWWKSEGNEDRRKPPMHGDIVARVKLEMGAVRAAQIKMRSNADHSKQTPSEPPATPEAKARILAESGFDIAANLARPFPKVGEDV